MIRRDDGRDWLLIAQVDHARIAAVLAEAWGHADVAPLSMRELVVPAIRHHDDGWQAWEREPTIEPATGRPRDFTEMPMLVATRIWSASIAAAARGDASASAVLRSLSAVLTERDRALTPEIRYVVDELICMRVDFTASELTRALHDDVRDGSVSEAAIRQIAESLEEAGVLRVIHAEDAAEPAWELAAERLAPSPLAGIWVSRHFCRLAEHARTSRRNDPAEVAALDQFLAAQRDEQSAWTSAVRDSLQENDIEPFLELGFRYVQAFDRMSLWLCCADREAPEDFTLPGGVLVRFEPRGKRRFRVQPFPFRESPLTLTTAAKRIPAIRCTSDDELPQKIRHSESVEVSWELFQ